MVMVRTNVTLPAELMREVDDLAGPRGRSAFVAEAISSKVKRERLRRTLDATCGIWVGTPSYQDPEESYRWVREQREWGNDEDEG